MERGNAFRSAMNNLWNEARGRRRQACNYFNFILKLKLLNAASRKANSGNEMTEWKRSECMSEVGYIIGFVPFSFRHFKTFI